MNSDLVSIIIPTYNRADLIGETLDSIINQTYTNWECLVVDDGSTDNTAKILKKYKEKDTRISFHNRPNNKPKGANACRNYGLEICNGKYVNWLDSDDIFHFHKLEKQIQIIESDNKNFSVCKSYVFENTIYDSHLKLKSSEVKTNDSFNDFLSKRIIIPIQAPIFKKKFLIDNDLFFDESLNAGQEWEFFARILYQFNDYTVVNIPLDYIRCHNNNISTSINRKEILYNYYLARLKIYNTFKERLDIESKIYLERYFLMMFKILLRQKASLKAISVWRKSLLLDKSFSLKDHINLLMSIITYRTFGKGDIFLSKVNKWEVKRDVVI